jgi:hypothetical protein
MSRIADTGYFLGDPANTHIAHFSPDGKRFVIVLRKGNLDQNANEFTLLLFNASEALHAARPEVLVRMSSSSNRDAISNVKWLEDNETLVFLGEGPGELPQVCKLNARTKQFERITNHPTEIRSYDISSQGRTLLYQALAPKTLASAMDAAGVQGVAITGQSLLSVITDSYEPPGGEEIFLETVGSQPVRISSGSNFIARGPVSLSPDGQYALIDVGIRDIPSAWSNYGGIVQEILSASHPKGSVLPFVLYLLLDVKRQSLSPLLDAPAVGWAPIWAPDGRSVFFKTYLPLDVADPKETAEREKTFYPVEVKIPGREIQRIQEEKWPHDRSSSGLQVTIDQGLERPQKLHISDNRSHQESLLMDLNPQFTGLQFGRVQVIEWTVKNNILLRGGLYLPPEYIPGKRYPLVIQTHGFTRDEEFSMDGLREWSSAFAARPLAAKGILVLQGVGFARQEDHDHYNDKGEFGSTPQEAGRNLNVLGIEGLIESLIDRGMVDKDRIGIVGFSRTVCFVGYLLTHSTRHFAAANLVDGTDCGYFEEMAFPGIAWDLNNINGGVAPFGLGLQKWFSESPGFNLDKVRTPVRLLALGPGSALGMWDWYAGLSLQKKPVDFVLLPDAAHLVVKPQERMVAQQGLVDWFCFWLKDEENNNAANVEQYDRWRQLRRDLVSNSSAVH